MERLEDHFDTIARLTSMNPMMVFVALGSMAVPVEMKLLDPMHSYLTEKKPNVSRMIWIINTRLVL